MEADSEPSELCSGHTPRPRSAPTDMNTPTVVALLHCFLIPLLVQSAPVASPPDLPPAFREATERAKTLADKILTDVPGVHGSTVNIEGLSLDPPSQTASLQMMVSSLGIPAPPALRPLSDCFTLEMSVNRMLAGCRLHQELLEVLSGKLSGLDDLKADLRDLLTQIGKMKEAAQLGDGGGADPTPGRELASRLSGNYEVQVAAHQTLSQLRFLCYDLNRSLRDVATNRPRPASAC